MENETIAQRALRLLSPIPTENFITGTFTDIVSSCCVVGHYVRLISDNPDDYSSENCRDFEKFGYAGCDLRIASEQFLKSKGNYGTIATVNNGNDEDLPYLQNTPKERSIALLNDMIKAGY